MAPHPRSRPLSGTLRYCPFCREPFERETECPEHELALVTLSELSADPEEADEDAPGDEPVSVYDPRFGRGLLLTAMFALLLGMVLPLVTMHSGAGVLSESALELASRAPNLWGLPCVGLALASVLYRRRTRNGMRRARLVPPVLALLGSSSLIYTLVRVHRAAEVEALETGIPIAITVEVGAYVLGLGLIAAILGGVRLGGH